jgi:hypothetical protein
MPGQSREGERFALGTAVGLYTAASLMLAWPWLSGAAAIPYDAKSQFYPQLVFLARSLAAGESPFWTSNIFAGWPQIADPQSLIFSPLHFAVALLDPSPSPRLADAVVFVLLYVGGLGVIAMFRDRGWHLGGALVAAVAFSFGGSAASRIQHVGQIESLVFLPLALWMLSRALERSSWRAGIGAGVFAAMIALGRDQVSMIAFYVLSGAVIWHWCGDGEWRKRILASVKPLAAGAIAGLLIIAVPVTLTALLAAASNRPDLGIAHAGPGSLHPANLLMLVFADLFGASDFHREFWGPPGFPWHAAFGPTGLFVAQNVGQIYCGALIAVIVLGPGLARGQLWDRHIRFYTVSAAVTLLYALGWYAPGIHELFELLPGVSLFRRPADATFVLCALLSIIGGYLIHRFLTGDSEPRRWQRGAETTIALALIVAAVGLALRVGVLDVAALPILWGVGFAALAIAALALARHLAPRSAAATAALLVAFSVGDLAFNHAPNESTGLPPATYDALALDTTNETVTLLKARLQAAAAPDRRDRVELVGIAYHWPNIGLIHDFDHLLGHNPLRLSDFVRATAAPDTVAGPDQRVFTPLLPSYRSILEDLFGVRFIATGVPIERIDSSIKTSDLNFIARTRDAYVYENPRALPRVLLASGWHKADFNELIASGGWPDIDPRRVVLLERPPPAFAPGALGGTASIARYRNTEVIVETDAPGGGILVLNDIWHPWWRATLDGRPVEILKANVLFRAVVVPPGRHSVRFTFHPFEGALAEIGQRFSRRPAGAQVSSR